VSGPLDPTKLDPCGCCEGEPEKPGHSNPAGLFELRYRIGTHPTFFEWMKARIHRWEVPEGDRAGQRPLAALSTRSADDPAIALMDAWAVVGDVLTFYQERIANEGFLRTATERRSILELARAIGYELDPGVAAETWLAFTVEEAEGAPTETLVPAGTQILSIPASRDDLPQTFETSVDLLARRSWNALRPRQREMELLEAPIHRLDLGGADLGLRVGDRLLAVDGDQREVFKVQSVTVEAPSTANDPGRTRVEVLPVDPEATPLSPGYVGVPAFLPPELAGPLPLTEENVQTYLLGQPSWTAVELRDRIDRLGWSWEGVERHLAALPRPGPSTGLEIHALRVKASIFGHNAPRWGTLPKEWRDARSSGSPYPKPWDVPDADDVQRDSQGNLHHSSGRVIYLDQFPPAVKPGSWVVLEGGGSADARAYRVEATVEESRADFAVSGKATRLELATSTDLALFEFRNTTVYGGSERLKLTEAPIEKSLEKSSIELYGFALGLLPGQSVIVRGQREDLAGVEAAEVVEVAEVSHSMERGTTRLVFAEPLVHRYRRETVTLNANVVLASHGETVAREVLGSGDGSRANQRFELKKPPLTHVGAETARGSVSTLTVRVDGVEWTEAPSLYGLGPASRGYVVRIDDHATPEVIFGDGERGARLPTGPENVTARYRSGIGSAGEVAAGRLSLLKTRPSGIREVVNPLPATGAGDPERLDDARENAPLTVLTLDRVVSLPDYEDFARAFAGIGKAQARTIWDGDMERVHITVADEDGDEVVPPLSDRLRAAIEGARDPLREVVLDSYRPIFFSLQADVRIDPAYLWEDVRGEIEGALLDVFRFERRSFGQPVTAAEVLEVIHGVGPVVMVDLNRLHVTGGSVAPPPGGLFNAVLDARVARWDEAAHEILPAQLLRIHPFGIDLVESKL
jgi:predicted phage baseplate assembly protein